MSRQPRGYLLDTLLALLLVCTATCKLPADEAERVARELEGPVWSGLQNLLIPAQETSETFAIHDVALESPVFDPSAEEVPVYRPARSRYNGIRQSTVYQDQQNIPWADGSKETGVPFRLVENQVPPNGQFPGASRESQRPRQSSELVWNEQGQYWGYAPQSLPNNNNNNARRGTSSGGGTGVVDDGTCLPPFCVPAVCSDSVNCAAPCITQNCDVGCFPPCIGGRDCVAGVCRCAALQRGSACRLLAANVCQQHFHLTCPIGCFLPVSLKLPPDCDCVFPPQALFTPSCALPVSLTCPDNCSGRGHCDTATGKCSCKPGFTGENCAVTDPCSPESGLTPCQFKCVSVNATRVCLCPSPFILQPDGVSCGLACPPGLTGTDCRTDIDECLTGTHNCQQDCINTFGSYRCKCREGFIPTTANETKCIPVQCNPRCVEGQGTCSSNGKCECQEGFQGTECEKDIDECSEGGQNKCHHRCINTFGSFRCECDPGYNLDPRDNRTCVRDRCFDSCVPGQGECQNGRCVCRRGFKGRDCELDVDECREQPNICDQRCVNSFGSFRCECDPGYNLDPRDNRTCVRDRCFDSCVPGQGECQNGRCVCRRGFKGRDCELDVDECREQPNICDQRCVNSFGSFRCECDPGYNLDPRDNRTCIRDKCFDSCVPGQGECQDGRCVCRRGFKGRDCELDVDECREQPNICDQRCVNSFGSFRCECDPGYNLDPRDNRTCVRDRCFDSCVPGQGECQNGRCVCRRGFKGRDCELDVDECREQPNICDQRCVNSFGSFRCECDPGYNLDPRDNRTCVRDRCFDSCVPGQGECQNGRCVCRRGFKGRDCELDVDECREQPNICDQRCVNSFGSFRCECDPGYNLDPRDNRTCVRDRCFDSCVPGQGECQDGRCVCRRGFKGRDCELDVDECREQANICDQRCVNSFGSFRCECDPGYNLDPRDNRTCVRDRCFDSCVPGQGECQNGRCVCRRGFKGRDCELDVDECREQPNICDQRCVNSFGSFRCECDPGYNLDPRDNRTCVRDRCFDSCVPGQGECQDGRCVCRRGFKGRDCELDVDECREQPNICDQRCVNSFGSFRCECDPGYNHDPRDNRTCVRDRCFDSCVPGQGECQDGRCVCRRGFKGRDCELDVDECREQPNICDQRCVNSFGSFRCECDPGYNLDPRDNRTCIRDKCFDSCVPGQGECLDGRCLCLPGFTGINCELDIDECLLGTHTCDQICINTPGSYRCECQPGYAVSASGGDRCERVDCNSHCVSGQGDCSGSGECQCRPGFEGEWCELEVDLCATDRHPCEHICVSSQNSFFCRCHDGFRPDPSDPSKCLPLGCPKECVPGQGICKPETGQCECKPGFQGDLCDLNVDECSLNNGGCSHKCVDTFGSFHCECPPGWRLVPNSTRICELVGACNPPCVPGQGTCVDTSCCKCNEGYMGISCEIIYNACKALKPCQQRCVNLGGGKYECSCWTGFVPAVQGDASTCVRSCLPGENCIHGECITRVGKAPFCRCKPGFRGSQCDEDINECLEAKGHGLCQQVCTNTFGSYRCSCDPGYVLQSDGVTCIKQSESEFGDAFRPGDWENVDACKEKQPCEQLCFNTREGDYQCACAEGFELNADGRTCSPTKLCNPPCANGARCLHGRCLCPPGYDGARCDMDIDECSLPASVHGCSFGCTNLPGSYECTCPPGYLLLADKKTCTKPSHDADCEMHCQNGGICTGKNTCRCLRGFTGKDCSLDIDECQRYRPCDPDYGFCVNRYGGFDCECKSGYVLLVDGRHCIEEARARQAPHLVYRGKGTKGVVVGGGPWQDWPRKTLGAR